MNESSKEAPVNEGTNETSTYLPVIPHAGEGAPSSNETSILRNHITTPQPGTSASTNTTNTSNSNGETLLPGIGIRQITK